MGDYGLVRIIEQNQNNDPKDWNRTFIEGFGSQSKLESSLISFGPGHSSPNHDQNRQFPSDHKKSLKKLLLFFKY